MLRKALLAIAALLPVMGCEPETDSGDAVVRVRRTAAAASACPHAIDHDGFLGAIVGATRKSAHLDDEQRGLLEDTLDEFARVQNRHAVSIALVNAALADGVGTCNFDQDDVAAATEAAAASAVRVGTAEAEAIDALHGILRPTQRMQVVRTALEDAQASPAPRRSLIRSLARLVELTDAQILAAADDLDEQDSFVEDHVLPPDPTDLLEAFSRRSFSAAEFGLGIDALARTEARGAWLNSSLEVICPVLDADQRFALADGLLGPLTADPAPGQCDAEDL